jgi:hypothetical protein
VDRTWVIALAPLIVVAVAFVAYCIADIVRAERVRHLPKWAWAIICVGSVPLGGVLYLVFGKER